MITVNVLFIKQLKKYEFVNALKYIPLKWVCLRPTTHFSSMKIATSMSRHVTSSSDTLSA